MTMEKARVGGRRGKKCGSGNSYNHALQIKVVEEADMFPVARTYDLFNGDK